MGKLIRYVVLLSHLSLILGIQQVKEPSQASDNFTLALNKHLHPKDQNEFSKRALQLGPPVRRRPPQPPRGKSMIKTLGLHSYGEPKEWRGRKRNASEEFRKAQRRTPLSPVSANFIPWKNHKSGPPDFYGRTLVQKERTSRLYNHSSSFPHQNKPDENRRYHKGGRNGRFQHSRHTPKICDPCNSVPWVPLLNVPDSYRQQRTHLNEIHLTSQQNFNQDFGSFGSDTHGGFGHGLDSHHSFAADSHNAFASDTHNVLLPPIPLVTPLEPIFDGTISSSFGLPVGNIPTGHGLLAPLNHLTNTFNRYGGDTVDYSASLTYLPSQDLVGGNPFPELSPVPIVPIHDSSQFYQIPDLVPPPVGKPVDVSNVMLTITEGGPANPPPGKPHGSPDLSSQSSAIQSSYGGGKNVGSGQIKNHNLGSLEIVKSVPLAEFTSSVNYPSPGSQQLLPLYPPLRSEHSGGFHDHPHKQEAHGQRSVDHSISDMNFLVPPPPAKKVESDTTFDSTKNTVLPFMNPPKGGEHHLKEAASAPKPLTGPSLSWLFSDHTPPPTAAKSTESVAQAFATETQEIASIVNSELRPVSPQAFPPSSHGSQAAEASKSKKIQIIIPYTTKNKNGYDNNALESVHHEVFQTIRPPVSKSPHGNNSSGESATSVRPTSSPRLPEANRHRHQSQLASEKRGDAPEDRYLSEMHHIIATNIRELLRDEIEKSQGDQNYPLQNNIDNWTALEYSNHKTVEAKAPKEIITQALSVTSIPGTSISHLLIPSKKIPTEYFGTTPVPNYDEPNTPPYNATTSAVNSKPFTAKSYATTNVYAPTSGYGVNHEKNYTEVVRGRVNSWGRLNENLVLPEARPGPRAEYTTASAWASSRLFGSSTGSERVEIVTPIPLTTNRNYTTYAYRRTTRHVRTTEAPTTTTTASTPTAETTKAAQKSLLLRNLNSTRLERVSNVTSLFNHKLNFNSSDSVSGTKNAKSVSVGNVTWTVASSQEEELVRLVNARGHLSINDIFPFRNKELPWEAVLNGSQPIASPTGRQRKSLIKQVNLPKQKSVAVVTAESS